MLLRRSNPTPAVGLRAVLPKIAREVQSDVPGALDTFLVVERELQRLESRESALQRAHRIAATLDEVPVEMRG